MVLQADGKILVGGSQTYGSQYFFALERYTADGTLDTTFDKDGRVTTTLDHNASVVALQILDGGKILVAGNGYEVARYNNAGSLDTTFGTSGIARLTPGGSSRSSSLAVQADGKIVVAGTTNQGANPNNAAFVRFTATGQTDISFGDRGKLVSDLGGADAVEAVVPLDSDRLLAAGSSAPDSEGTHSVLAKFNTGYAKKTTTTALTAGATTSTYGQAVTLTATVTADGDTTPTGNVIFKIGDTQLTTVKLNDKGVAVLKTIALPAGTQKVTATYVGTSVLATSTSSAATVAVARAQVNVVTATVPATAVYGQAVTLGARVTAKSSVSAKLTGTVLFMDGSKAIGTAALGQGGLAQFVVANLTPGTHTIRAIFGGDGNSIPTASPSPVALTITKAATSVALGVTGDLTVSGQALSLVAQVRAPKSTLSPAGRITFRDGAKVLATVQLDATGKATVALPKGLAKGSHSLTATYEGNGGYLVSTSPAATV
ncbi:MAG: Ig-like domain repeat protein, partial [Gemmataceae bacterium]